MKTIFQLLLLATFCLAGLTYSANTNDDEYMKSLSRILVNNQAKLEAQQNLLEKKLEKLLSQGESDKDQAIETPSQASGSSDQKTTSETTAKPIPRAETTTTTTSSSGSSTPATEKTGDQNISALFEEMIEEKVKNSISSSLKELFLKMGLGNVSTESLFPDSLFSNKKPEEGESKEGESKEGESKEGESKEGESKEKELGDESKATQKVGTPSLKGGKKSSEEGAQVFIPGAFSEEQLFLFNENSVYPIDRIGTKSGMGGLQYITGRDIKTVITSCKFVSISWASDLIKATNRVYSILLISEKADIKFRSNIILTESKLLNTYSNCDLLLGKQPKKYPNRNMNFRFPQTSRETINKYRDCSLSSIKNKQIKRIGLLKSLEAFINNVKTYNHLNLCSAAGFDSAREALLGILLNFYQIVKIDLKRLEVALVKSKL
ncbi:hypothetical protein OIY81_2412 [Cryptosporidium canis]|uniref:Signal peptide-containing protein n=1 Tax=Cryptosporidium canis TaxID=195482 RepID=A0ABQ8P3J6_9CRYT|nr:hypothetical protein OJ252_3034 [Cryptosporidium canis]KAJ1609278.1 hypothetical protein OIY81_2412 [Cryptosporidium canis]